MVSVGERLEPKLEAVLCRLCSRLGVLTLTNAVKLPYLVDVVASHVLGQPITHGTHQTWEMGVVTTEVWSYIRRGGDAHDPFIIRDSNQYAGGKRVFVDGEPEVELAPEEEEIVDLVADLWGRYNAESLGRLTKTLNTQFEPSVWGANQSAALGEEAFARLSAGWQAFSERLAALDFRDQKHWGEPIQDPREYLRRKLGA